MMSEHDDDQPTWLDESLQEFTAASLSGHPGPTMSFRELMAKVDALERSISDEERLQRNRFAFGLDVYELGVDFLERGRLDRAEHWLRLAAQFDIPEAVDKLADLNTLRAMLVDLESQELPERPTASRPHRDGHPRSVSAGPAEETIKRERDAILDRARQEAERIVEDARRQATEILAKAENEAAAAASSPATAGLAPLLWTVLDEARRPRDEGPDRRADWVWGVSGAGKSHLNWRLRQQRDRLQPASMHRSVIIVNSLAEVPDAFDGIGQGPGAVFWRRRTGLPELESKFWWYDCDLDLVQRFRHRCADDDEFLDRMRDALVRLGANRQSLQELQTLLVARAKDAFLGGAQACGAAAPLPTAVHGCVSGAFLGTESSALEAVVLELTGSSSRA